MSDDFQSKPLADRPTSQSRPARPRFGKIPAAVNYSGLGRSKLYEVAAATEHATSKSLQGGHRVSFTPHRAARKSFVHDMWHHADKSLIRAPANGSRSVQQL